MDKICLTLYLFLGICGQNPFDFSRAFPDHESTEIYSLRLVGSEDDIAVFRTAKECDQARANKQNLVCIPGRGPLS